MKKRIVASALSLAVGVVIAIAGAGSANALPSTEPATQLASPGFPCSPAPSDLSEPSCDLIAKRSAAGIPQFRIYFARGCASAGHYYTGATASEAWINDTFNDSSTGPAGFGQKIRNNAASIYLYTGTTNIRVWYGTSMIIPWEDFYGLYKCFGLSQANYNTAWSAQ